MRPRQKGRRSRRKIEFGALIIHGLFPSLNCFGGHFTSPKEQKTQQSPGFGLNIRPQDLQS